MSVVEIVEIEEIEDARDAAADLRVERARTELRRRLGISLASRPVWYLGDGICGPEGSGAIEVLVLAGMAHDAAAVAVPRIVGGVQVVVRRSGPIRPLAERGLSGKTWFGPGSTGATPPAGIISQPYVPPPPPRPPQNIPWQQASMFTATDPNYLKSQNLYVAQQQAQWSPQQAQAQPVYSAAAAEEAARLKIYQEQVAESRRAWEAEQERARRAMIEKAAAEARSKAEADARARADAIAATEAAARQAAINRQVQAQYASYYQPQPQSQYYQPQYAPVTPPPPQPQYAPQSQPQTQAHPQQQQPQPASHPVQQAPQEEADDDAVKPAAAPAIQAGGSSVTTGWALVALGGLAIWWFSRPADKAA